MRFAAFLAVAVLFAVGALENFGYRQLISFWRLHGLVSALRRVQTWGDMPRRGFGPSSLPRS